jgi:peptidoglycan/LPS O-acetylase OafA/YrhL
MNLPLSFRKITRIPCLDGWRCISIIIVLIAHSREVSGYHSSWDRWIRWLPDGHFGVEVFFVISGFLITYLLFQEREKRGNINLKEFYIRRVLRIFPAYFCYLAVVFIITFITAAKLSLIDWLSSLSFTVNYAKPPWIIGHLWSLSVEEQFYLIWPLLLVILSHSNRFTPKRILVLLSIPIFSSPIFRIIGYIHPDFIAFGKHSFFTCWDSLAIGCLLAVLLCSFGFEIERFVKKYPYGFFIAGLALIIIPLVATRLQVLGILTVPFTITCNAIGVALLIALSLIYPKKFKILDYRPLAFIGVTSYSIYLWQQLFCASPSTYGLNKSLFFMNFPLWIVSALAAAFLSYHSIEKPFLRLKSSRHLKVVQSE